MKKPLPDVGNGCTFVSKFTFGKTLNTWQKSIFSAALLFLLFWSPNLLAQLNYTQNFNSGLSSWTGTGWSSTTTTPCEGTNSIRKNNWSNNQTGIITSPLIGTSNGGVVTFSFTYKIIDFSGGAATTGNFGFIDVQYSDNANGPWTTVHSITQANHTPSTTCATVAVPTFSAAPGNFYVRYNTGWASGDYYVYFDEVSITQGAPPACVQPSGLSATNVTSSGATLGWTENGSATSWEVEYGLLGFTPGTGTVVTAGSNPYLLTSLPGANTTYSYYVRSNCGANGYSAWSGPLSFTTLCASQLSGTITIDPSLPASATNFQTFSALASELNVCGVSGPVIVNVKEGTYNEQVTFGAITGSSSTNKITIQANPSNTAPAVLTYSPGGSTDNFTVNLIGASNISFKNLTINSSGASFSRIIQIGGTCANLEFDGNTFNGPSVSTSNTSQATFYYGASPVFDGLIVKNNTFSNNSHIFYYLGSSATFSDSLVFENNTASGYYAHGLYCGYVDRMWIKNNTFVNSASTTTQYGIYLFGTSSNPSDLAIIEGNNIVSNTPSIFYGIYMSYTVATMANPSRIVNNMVSNTSTTGTTTVYGLYPFACSYLNIFHNTVAINSGSATASRAAYFNTTGTTYNNVDVRNNIFSHAGPSGYAIEVSNLAHTNNYLSNLNYNVYNYQPTNAAPFRYNNANSANLAAWQLSSSKDANSFEGDPVFVSISDLHVLGPVANNVGDNTVGVTTDIDGQTRPGGGSLTVDIGADEFTAISADIALLSGMLDRDLCYSVNDTVKLTIKNVIGGTVDFSITPLTAVWSVAGPTNSNGSFVVNTGTLAAGATMVVKGGGVQMPSGGTYTLSAHINPNAANGSALNDSVGSVSLNVNKLVATVPSQTMITSSTDSVELKAISAFFPSAGFFISEICHFKTTTGQPTNGWPTYLSADDYIEITGAPFSDLGGITLEQWSTTAMYNSYTFPSGTILGPNGTAIIVVGTPNGSPSPSDYYYFANTSFGFSSGTSAGRILKDGVGTIIDAVGYSGYSFPAAANVSASDWSSPLSGGSGTSGIRLIGPDNNTGSNWVVSSSTNPQDPNTVNSGVSAPAAPPVSNFEWVLDGNVVDTNTSYWAGPYSMNGTYKYVAKYNSTQCGFIYDTATVIVNVPCTYNVDMIDTWGDGWNGAVVTFSVNGSIIDSIGYNFTSGFSSSAALSFFDMDSVEIALKNAGSYPAEIGFTVKNPQGITLFSHVPTTGLTSGHVFTTMYSQCYVPCPPPTSLGVAFVSSSSADVYWTTGGATNWVIEYGLTGFTQGAGTIMAATNDTTTISGLSAETSYQFYVRDNCGGGDSSAWVGPLAFSTLCASFTLPFMEDFEVATGTSGCWTQQQVTGTKAWTFATGAGGGAITTANGGTTNARFTSSSGGPHVTKLISPVIDASTLTYGTLKFAYGQEVWFGDQNYLNVYYRDSANGAWNLVWSDSTNRAAWTIDSAAIPSTSSTLQIAFEGVDDWGRANVVDDVQLYSGSCGNWNVTVNVTDGLAALAGAQVVLNGDTMTTSATGNVMFQNLPNGSYPYSITLGCYATVFDTVIVNCANETKTDTMSMLTFDASINVTDGTVALQNAMVVLNGDTTMTDALGDAVFQNLPNGMYIYTISKACYVSLTDTVTINCDDESMMNTLMIDSITSSGTASICKGDSIVLGTQVISTAGIYVEVFTSALGCDSIVTLTVAVDSVDNTVTANGLILTANLAGGTYQWFDCTTQMIIAGATSQSYTAMSNGSFAVVVSDGNCTDTSACIDITDFGIDKYGLGNFGLYPNPNDGYFTITGLTDFGNDAKIEIVNLAGAVVYSEKIVANGAESHKIDLRGYPAGVYHVRVSSEHGSGTKPFVIR